MSVTVSDVSKVVIVTVMIIRDKQRSVTVIVTKNSIEFLDPLGSLAYQEQP